MPMTCNSGLKIEGSLIQKGKEKNLEIIQYSQECVAPRDMVSGLQTGKRAHKPICFRTQADRSFPAWEQVLFTNDIIKTMKFNFWTTGEIDKSFAGNAGKEVIAMTHELKNATVCRVQTQMLNNKNKDLSHYEFFMDIEVTFEEITITWTNGGLMVKDGWNLQTS